MVNKQKGFTLIELVVVIVILGILAAVAFPKFADLSGDAKQAVVNAAKAAVVSAAVIQFAKNKGTKASITTILNETTLENITSAGSTCGNVTLSFTGTSSASVSFSISDYCS